MDSVGTEMMDYYDYDEREQKQMRHTIGPVRIYRTGPDESEEGCGYGMAVPAAGTSKM